MFLDTSSSSHKHLFYPILVILSLSGLAIVFLATQYGIGATPDSVVYIGAAKNITLGDGFSMNIQGGDVEMVTHYAPLYSLVISLFGFFGVDPVSGARWLNVFLFGANIFLIGAIILPTLYGKGLSTVGASLFGSLLILTSPTLLELHLMAWTEPLFLFLGFMGLFLLGAYFQNLNWRFLILAAFMISLAFLTRYAGVSLVISGLVSIIIFTNQSFLNRVKSALVFFIISTLPLLLWILRNLQTGGTATSRELHFHPIGFSQLSSAVTTISSWILIPASVSIWIKLIPLLGLASLFIFILGKSRRLSASSGISFYQDLPPFIQLLVVFSVLYLMFLIFSISFVDANTSLDSRILSPLYVSGIVVVLYLLEKFLTLVHKPTLLKGIFVSFGLLLLTSNLWNGSTLVVDAYRTGIGFNSLAWKNSDILREVEKIPQDVVIYSNAPEAIYFHFNRPAVSLPRKIMSTTQQVNQNFNYEMTEMKDSIDRGRGIVIYFSALIRPTLVSDVELKEQLFLKVLTRYRDGTIYTGLNDINSHNP
jgi:hypothetical protein